MELQTTIFLTFIIAIFVTYLQFLYCSRSGRKKELKALKKGFKKYRVIDFKYIKNLTPRIVSGGVDAYEQGKDFLINLVVNGIIIKIALDVLSNMPEGKLKFFVSLALLSHVMMWVGWMLDQIGLISSSEEDGCLFIWGYFVLVMFGLAMYSLGMIFVGLLILIIAQISIVLNLISVFERWTHIKIKLIKHKRKKKK